MSSCSEKVLCLSVTAPVCEEAVETAKVLAESAPSTPTRRCSLAVSTPTAPRKHRCLSPLGLSEKKHEASPPQSPCSVARVLDFDQCDGDECFTPVRGQTAKKLIFSFDGLGTDENEEHNAEPQTPLKKCCADFSPVCPGAPKKSESSACKEDLPTPRSAPIRCLNFDLDDDSEEAEADDIVDAVSPPSKSESLDFEAGATPSSALPPLIPRIVLHGPRTEEAIAGTPARRMPRSQFQGDTTPTAHRDLTSGLLASPSPPSNRQALMETPEPSRSWTAAKLFTPSPVAAPQWAGRKHAFSMGATARIPESNKQ